MENRKGKSDKEKGFLNILLPKIKKEKNEKMSENKLEIIDNNVFENIKHIDKDGNECWLRRDLMIALKYTKWENFKKVIDKAIIACKSSNYNVLEHFVGADKLLKMGNNANMKVSDFKLSRYACYLIAQNADSRKKVVNV